MTRGVRLRFLRRAETDFYGVQASKLGLPSRAGMKLVEMNKKHRFIRHGATVVDLGASPGGFSLVACRTVAGTGPGPASSPPRRRGAKGGLVVAVDQRALAPKLLVKDPVAAQYLRFLEASVFDDNLLDRLRDLVMMERGVDADDDDGRGAEPFVHSVISDMSPPHSGDKSIHHDHVLDLCERAFTIARQILIPGRGSFLCKMTRGGNEKQFKMAVDRHFQTTRFVKPESSRKESPEIYLLAQGYLKLCK